MTLLLYSLILTAVTFVQSSRTCKMSGDPHNFEKDLRREIFRDYDKNVRPVKEWTSAVVVRVGMSLLRIGSVDEQERKMSLDTRIDLKWTDEFLQWNPDEYGNITVLQIPPTEIWLPDIALYTGFSDTSIFPTVRASAILSHTGEVVWITPFTLNSYCPMKWKRDYYHSELSYFLECSMKIGSWTYSGNMLDLQLLSDTVDLSHFEETNVGWALHKIIASGESKFYVCCPEAYKLVHYNVTIRQR